MTVAVIPSTFKQVKKIADENNVAMLDEEFHCRGKFTVMHANRPNAKDLAAAKDFAANLIK